MERNRKNNSVKMNESIDVEDFIISCSIEVKKEKLDDYQPDTSLFASPVRRKNNFLNQLKSDLSPKYTQITSNPEARLSRYGRHQKQKENFDFVPVELTRFVTKTSPKKNKKEDDENNTVDEDNSLEDVIEVAQIVEVIDIDETEGSVKEVPLTNQKEEKLSDVDSAKGSSIDLESETNFKVGQIFWALFQTRHWPCLVCPEPETKLVTNTKTLSKTSFLKVHVSFFADNGRRSWIVEKNLMPFDGYDNYCLKIINETFPSRVKAFVRDVYTKKKSNPMWMRAIQQAEEFTIYPIQDRLEIFLKSVEYERLNKTLHRRSLNATPTFHANGIQSSTPNNLNVEKGKRLRSPTPESPAFEVLVPMGAKRIKRELSNDSSQNVILRYFQSMDMDTTTGTVNEFDDDVVDKEIFTATMDILKSFNFGGRVDKETETKLAGCVKTVCTLAAQKSRISQRVRLQNLRNTKVFGQTIATKEELFEQIEPKHVPIKKIKKEPKDLAELFIFDNEKNYLFQGLPKGAVCRTCLKPNNLLKCTGKCCGHYHKECSGTVEEQQEENAEGNSKFKCSSCILNVTPNCFVCGESEEAEEEEAVLRCQVGSCGRFYHIKCLRLFPQYKLVSSGTSRTLNCPYHTCHTCVSDDPRGKSSGGQTKVILTKCVKCPTSYHSEESCIPAGSVFITTTQMICPKHTPVDKANMNINVNWCFICSEGGELVCCETCPTAFHVECLKLTPPEGRYVCEECESGRMPLYHEIVWCKQGSFRWWPALIVPPPDIPIPVQNYRHAVHEYAVRFFGTHNYAWMMRKRVFLYQEGDSESNPGKYGNLHQSFIKSIAEAKEIYELLKALKYQNPMIQELDLQPPYYRKLKANSYVAPLKAPSGLQDPDDISVCNCKATDPSPCGYDAQCINRAVMVECDPSVCQAGEKCQNQDYKKRNYPPLEFKRVQGKGWGLYAKQDIEFGMFVIEYVGEVINNIELDRRLKEKHEQKDENYYFLTMDAETTIDAGPKGNLARFMNHSCEPNCETQKWTVGGATCVGLFAATSIKANTELTFNYNFECVGDNKKVCHCGASKCSGLIGEKYKAGPSKKSINQKMIEKPEAGKQEIKKKKRVRAKTKKNKSAPRPIVEAIDSSIVKIEKSYPHVTGSDDADDEEPDPAAALAVE